MNNDGVHVDFTSNEILPIEFMYRYKKVESMEFILSYAYDVKHSYNFR